MQRWTVCLEGGPRRVNHAAVAVDQKIYSFGGYCTGDDFENTRPMDIHVLNCVSYKWTALPLPKPEEPSYLVTPYQRYGHTAIAIEERAYVWGGRNDRNGADNKLYCFNTVSLEWSQPDVDGQLPGARDGHSACVINNVMYIFGGYEDYVEKFSNEVHALDFNTMTWSLVRTQGKPARWRDFHSATGIGDCMYIFGGRSDKAGPYHTNNELYCHKLQVFNTKTCTWHEPVVVGHVPLGRRSHSAFLYQEKLYIFGGYNGIHDVHFADMYRFDPQTNHWSIVKVQGVGPCPRRRQCCCLIDHRVFLFGGTSPCPVPTENAELDLMDHSDLHVLDFSPSLRTLCLLTVAENGLDTSCLPKDLRWELSAMTTNSNISRPLNTSG